MAFIHFISFDPKLPWKWGFPGVAVVKKPPANAGDSRDEV